MKTVRYVNSAMVWINLALIMTIGLVLLFFMRPSSERGETLARVNGQKLHRAGLDMKAEQKIRSLEFQKFDVLEQSVNRWIENAVLSKEAVRRSISVEELISEEIWKKIRVTRDDILLRYAQSPAADALDYDTALKKIGKELRLESYKAIKSEFVAALSKENDIRNFLKAPQGYSRVVVQSSFPVYSVRPASRDVVNEKVVAPPSLGAPDAPILLEIFSDFMCPYSAKFAQTAKEALQNYPDKLRIEFRHLPLSFHKTADTQSQAAVCAQEQGGFWEYHDALMAKQGPKDAKELEGIASSIGLDPQRFSTCLSDGHYQALVSGDVAESSQRGARGTPSYFINGRRGSGAVPLETIKKYVDWHLSPKGAYPGAIPTQPAKPASAKRQPTADLPDQAFNEADLKDSPSAGRSDAPVTIIEFIDFHCPYCKSGADTMDAIRADRKDIRFISKQYPLPFHKGADLAAIGALCAHEQNKYWEYRKRLFGDYWGKNQVSDLKSVAKDVGLDSKKFEACFDGAKTRPQVEAETQMGSSKGVSGTPAYFINGKLVFGAQPTQKFTQIIEEKKVVEGNKKR